MANHKLVDVTLDESTVVRWSADVEHERRIAIFDLLEENSFELEKSADEAYEGPYKLTLATIEGRLNFDVKSTNDDLLMSFRLAMTPFRRIIREYFAICDSYYEAIKTASPSQIEAIDMGRRGLHNQGSELLQERLEGKIKIDRQTARRLFTLVCVLHLKENRGPR
ncbi:MULTISPECIES: UPF0262 family protein [Kordiimonas]|jgi:uncharacterized protein (UPF0262 family)|uniref:UPF0262 protein SAMN04488071_0584 n=1 Tax=Kordiimonas lacus TaxID=637679 RepID=A0A1G6UGF6_9PROT|nr:MULTISPECIES: UPF0262 family protein [Kordiimonas]SDD40488.1 Uncharacterized protein, UPF0262 family [Kordiimonas lacus]